MADATITPLQARAVERTTPRDCGVARIIDLRPRPTGRLIDPMSTTPAPRPTTETRSPHPFPSEPGRLARALMAAAGSARS